MIKITDYIDDICDLLKISKPIISYDTSTFESYTMLAQCDPENSTIYMRKPLAVTPAPAQPDYLFAIAHELRHVWQIRYHNDYFFEKYKPRKDMPSVTDYNLQIAEVDANAFGAFILTTRFGLQPMWYGMEHPVVDAINLRACEIIEDFDLPRMKYANYPKVH